MNNDMLDFELQDITADLYSLKTFTGIIENEIHNASDKERTVDFANDILSCLTMQTAKIKGLIATMEELANKVRQSEVTK